MTITPEVRTIPFGRPLIGDEEREAVMEVLSGHILTHGPQCKGFETEFAGFMGGETHCVSVSSGMAALHLAYLHYGIGEGDEVIVPAQTHTATAHAVEWVGATPVFVDCDPATGNVTAAHIEKAITPRTRAISVVHFVGIPCDMEPIMKLAEKHNLRVIEDCAIAIGGRGEGKHVGLIGDVGCFSFYPVKHITTGEGGLFTTKHHDVAEAVHKLRAFGVDRTHFERKIPGMYDVPTLGLNYRMSELQAAIGRVQIKRLGDILARRKVNFEVLLESLSGISDTRVLNTSDPRLTASYYCLSIVLEGDRASRRNDIVEALNTAGVGTSIYYPQPVPRMTYYKNKYGYEPDAYPNAAEISDCSIALPVGPHLSVDDMQHIGVTFVRVLREVP